MARQVQIRIKPDGSIEAETLGLKGARCLDVLPQLETMLGALATESEYTAEYHETEQAVEEQQRTQTVTEWRE